MEGRYRTRSATTKPTGNSKLVAGMNAVSYTHLTLPTTPYV